MPVFPQPFVVSLHRTAEHPGEVRLPRTWERLVKVLHIEVLVAFGRGVDAEVAWAGIATHLHLQARHGSCSAIARHHDYRSAQKAERGGAHPPVAKRHELRQPG